MSGSEHRCVDAAARRSRAMAAGDPEEWIDTEATSKRVLTAVASTPASLFLGILASLLITVFADRSAALEGPERIALWCWWFSIAATFGCALLISDRFSRSRPDPQAIVDTVLRGRTWWIATVACSLALGSVSWVLMPSPDRRIEMIVIAFMIAVSAAQCGTQASYPPLMVRFLAPTLALFTLGLWRLDDLFYVVAGVGFVIYGVGLYSYATTQARYGRRTIALELQANAARREADQARLEAERASAKKITFLSAASHDLRQPMHALVQYQDQLRRRNRDPQLSPTIELIGSSLEALQSLLKMTLDVSKLASGAVDPVMKNLKIGNVIELVSDSLDALVKEKGLNFSVSYDGTLVRTDGALLERILSNLLLNAIRYTSNGTVGIRARRAGRHLVIRVFDTGRGIPREQRERIFGPFYQIDNSARNRSRGRGLGLAIVQKIASLLSVRIRLQSKPGKGSIFRLTMPALDDAPLLTETPGDGSRQQAASRDYARGATVVLIDDDVQCLQATEGTLIGFGCQVISAASASEALRCLREQDCLPNLVISDYRLEDMTGIEAISLIRSGVEAQFGDAFPVHALLISGDTAPVQVQMVADAGLRMLHKPTRPQELYTAVNAELVLLAQGEG